MKAFVKFVSIGIVAISCLTALQSAQAKTTQVFCVNPNGDNSCVSTISAAIALVTAKDAQILVSGGSYSDTVTINTGANPKKLTLSIIGSGADFVTINGNGGSVFSIGPKATVTLMGMTITNGAGQFSSGSLAGGGIFASGATLTVTECIVSANQANFGAGIYASNTKLNITSSAITGNSAPDLTSSQGGGLYFAATKASKLTVQNSIIDSNSAFDGGGSFLINPTDSSAKPKVTISDTTVGNNSAVSEGGGIFVQDASLTLVNSTISGNSQSDPAGQGAGLFSTVGNVTLNNVTIANNSATGAGGGIAIDPSNKKFVFSNALIATNVASSGPDCSATGKSMNSHDHNLIGDITGCTIVGKISHNLTGAAPNSLNPLLAPLGDNGGGPAPDSPPETQALMPTSPALAAGNPATPSGKGSTCEPTDETGLLAAEARTKGDCDIGAYQLPD